MGSPAPLRLLAPCCSPTQGCARWCTGTTRGTPGLCAALFLSVFLLFDTSHSSGLSLSLYLSLSLSLFFFVFVFVFLCLCACLAFFLCLCLLFAFSLFDTSHSS